MFTTAYGSMPKDISRSLKQFVDSMTVRNLMESLGHKGVRFLEEDGRKFLAGLDSQLPDFEIIAKSEHGGQDHPFTAVPVYGALDRIKATTEFGRRHRRYANW